MTTALLEKVEVSSKWTLDERANAIVVMKSDIAQIDRQASRTKGNKKAVPFTIWSDKIAFLEECIGLCEQKSAWLLERRRNTFYDYVTGKN